MIVELGFTYADSRNKQKYAKILQKALE